MRILVVSDSHGDIFHLMQAVREQPRAEVILHLGDGEREAMELRDKLPAGCTLIQVRGNNDWGSRAPLTEERVLEGKRLFFRRTGIGGKKALFYPWTSLSCQVWLQRSDLRGPAEEGGYSPVRPYPFGLYFL